MAGCVEVAVCHLLWLCVVLGALLPYGVVCSAGAAWAPTCPCNKAVCAVKGSALHTVLGHACSPCRGNIDSRGDQDSRTHLVPCP